MRCRKRCWFQASRTARRSLQRRCVARVVAISDARTNIAPPDHTAQQVRGGSMQLAAEGGCWVADRPVTPTMLANRVRSRSPRSPPSRPPTFVMAAPLMRAAEAAVAGSGSESVAGALSRYRLSHAMPLLPTALLLACQPPSGADRSAAPTNCRLLERARAARARGVACAYARMYICAYYAYAYAFMSRWPR